MASTSAILGFLPALPVMGALAVLALPGGEKAKRPGGNSGARAVALGVCLATLAVAVMAATWMNWRRGGGAEMQLVLKTTWVEVHGARLVLGADGMSMPLVLLVAGMGIVGAWAGYGVKRGAKAFFVMWLLWLGATLGALVAVDVVVWLAFTLMALVVLFFLVRGDGMEGRAVRGVRFYLGVVAGAVAVGTLLVVAQVHTTNFAELGGAGEYAGVMRGRAGAGWLMVIGLGAMMGAVPVHRWVVGMVKQAALPVAMVVPTMVQMVGAYGLVRVAIPLFEGQFEHAGVWRVLAIMGVVTMGYGALAALGEKTLRGVLAYVAVANGGLVLLGLALRSPTTVAGAMDLVVGQGVAMAMAFFIAGMVEERTGGAELDKLGGLGGHLPAFAGWAAVGFLAVMGLPGMGVFAGELLIVLGAFEGGGVAEGAAKMDMGVGLGIGAAVCLVVVAGAVLGVYQRVFLGPPRPEHSNVARMSPSEKWILALLAVVVIALGVYPMMLTESMRAAVAEWVGNVRGGL